METNKKLIIDSLEYASEKQVKFILDILGMNRYSNKKDLMNLAEITGTIDTAIPLDYSNRIKDIYPNFLKGNNVYDYRNNSYGSMLNINDEIVSRILNLKN